MTETDGCSLDTIREKGGNIMSEKPGTLTLPLVWGIRMKLSAESEKLWAEGKKLWAEGDKLRAEGDKLRAEGNKLWAEGDKLWAEGILEAYGNITLEWKYRKNKDSYACQLGNGEIFEP